MASLSLDPLIGRRLGDYILRQRIGEGGFGTVYRAQQVGLSREAVVKLLRKTRTDADVVRRFTAEAQVASRLDHPYAAHIYGFGAEDDGQLWIAMEFVRGAPLDVTVAVHGAVKLERFVGFFERLCEVVHTAHEQGIVHRDIKPANIMVLDRAGKLLPKLLDLGIAKVVADALDLRRDPTAVADRPIAGDDTLRTVAGDGTLPMVSDTREDRVALPHADASPSNTGNDLVGSPRYMAPEQWHAPGLVDARTDVYALGLVAYEALVGKPAFEGGTVAELMMAHEGAIPHLPDGFPPGLDAVIARALAKHQGERWKTALELAKAFRAASVDRHARADLPELDRRIHNRFVGRGPESLADAIVALDVAENPHEARDVVQRIAQLAAHLVGVLAISCRTRVGAGAATDADAVLQRLRRLRREGLGDHEWLELARDLARPFEAKRDAHPIPELVATMFPRDGEPNGYELLRRLLDERVATDPGESLRIRLPDLVRDLGEALGALWFLTDYEVVVPRAGRVERFVGSRRVPRATLHDSSLAEHRDRPVLLDGDGVPVLVLWPLVRAESPTAGADAELFMFDGPGRSGARLVAARHAFELHDPELWDWFQRTLFVGADSDARADLAEERPYRGLSAFTVADAQLFFGREREVDAFVNRLRVTPLLAVVGPSGAGKSSFVQAGALAALDWRSVIVRPGVAPMTALATKLGIDATALAQRPELLGETLRARPDVVLVVDQLEELFTLCSDAAEREQFARAITAVARTADDRARVIITLRDDFLMRAEALPALRERLAVGLHLLGTPQREDLLRIVIEPARRCGYELEDRQLGEDIVGAVANQPNALAMLSFTAAALWELRDRHFRHLSRKAYVAIGGVGGALVQHAEATLAAMPAEHRALVRDAFRRLVTAEGTRAVMTRAELVQVLGGTSKAEAVIEALVAARLLATSEAEQGERIEVTHEALLVAWPRLVEWRREDLEGARLRDQLRAAARQWDERGRNAGLLWRGDALAEFQIWRGRTPGGLTDLEDAFTRAALREQQRGRRLRRLALVVAFTFLLAALGGALWLNSRTKIERARAVDNMAALYEEQGRAALLAGHPAHALVYLGRAYELGAHDAAMEVLLAAASRPLEAQRLVLAGHTGKIWTLAYSHDGRRLATGGADGTARLWDVATGKLVFTLAGHSRDIWKVAFVPDDSMVATASWDGTVRVWRTSDGQLAYKLDVGGLVYTLDFDPTGSRLATGYVDEAIGRGSAQIWDARTGAKLADLMTESFVTDVAWNHSGDRLVICGGDGFARVWTAAGAPVTKLAASKVPLNNAVWSHDDRQIATASEDATAALWDASDGHRLAVFLGHTDRVAAVAFAPDDKRLVTASYDNTARIWDVETNRLVASLASEGPVYTVAFSPDGSRIVTAGTVVHIWSANGALLALRDGHTDQVQQVVFRGDGDEIATASWDGTARLWSVAPDFLVATSPTVSEELRSLVVSQGHVIAGSPAGAWITDRELHAPHTLATPAHALAIDAEGTRLATGGDGVLRVWTIADEQPLTTLVGNVGDSLGLQFSRDGHRLLAASNTGVRIWDLASSKVERELSTAPARSVAFSADERTIVATFFDGRIERFETATGAAHSLGTTPTAFRVELAAGDRMLTAHQDTYAKLWDLAHDTSRVLGHRDLVSSARFSPDAALVITTSFDHQVRIWDVATAKLLLVLQGHTLAAVDARFGTDDTAYSTSSDGTIKRWRIDRDHRSVNEIQTLIRCRVPLALDANGSIVERTPQPCTN